MKVFRIILCSAVILFMIFESDRSYGAVAVRAGINKIVIDAGHGGKDPGCVSKQFREKDITLKVALRLGELVKDNYPEVQVVYTRKTDVFIPIIERGDIANKANADLFISIHVNASRSRTPSGMETFVMGVDKSNANMDIAMRENDVITYESDYTANYEGYAPGSSESLIIFSLMQYSFLEQSMFLANLVQQQYARNTSIPNRGVKQAGFLVLWRTAMPSILTEIGFLSNSGDESILGSKNGQEQIARSLFNAFSAYKTKSEGRGTLIVLDTKDLTDRTEKSEPETTVKSNESAGISDIRNVSESSKKLDNQRVANRKELIYRVQVMSSAVKVSTNSSNFGVYRGKVEQIVVKGLYKYYVGNMSTMAQAQVKLKEVRAKIKGAFIVPFLDGSPITLDQAREVERKK